MSADPTAVSTTTAVPATQTTTTAYPALPAPYPYPYPYPTATLLTEVRWLIARCTARALDPVSAQWVIQHRHAQHYWQTIATMLTAVYPSTAYPYPWPSPMPVPSAQDLMLLAVIDRLHTILDQWADWLSAQSIDRGVAVIPWAAGSSS